MGGVFLGAASLAVRRVLVVALLAGATACSDEVQVIQRQYPSAAERAVLIEAANQGDWRAAKELALYRFWVLDLQDAETERLWRIWARWGPLEHVGLGNLLAHRCSIEDRTEAVQILQRAIDQNVATDPQTSDMLNSGITEYRQDLEAGRVPEPCTMR